jgi:hypothetical protein
MIMSLQWKRNEMKLFARKENNYCDEWDCGKSEYQMQYCSVTSSSYLWELKEKKSIFLSHFLEHWILYCWSTTILYMYSIPYSVNNLSVRYMHNWTYWNTIQLSKLIAAECTVSIVLYCSVWQDRYSTVRYSRIEFQVIWTVQSRTLINKNDVFNIFSLKHLWFHSIIIIQYSIVYTATHQYMHAIK